ncbi:MAG: methionine adenosyltransferase [Pseudomonadota bacterium]|jgi:S-adenosylmethionine synthetase|nr:methionine adenosyltransferase [Alphaproteobacteria bacterium]
MAQQYLFTSESVSAGHPDKVCDQISDLIVDMYLEQDPESRLAIETLATTNRVVIAGEYRSTANIKKSDIENAIRELIKEIGYEQEGFHYEALDISNYLHAQSADIAVGVDAAHNKDEGAGDQGIMFGYACDETDVLMPAALYYSHRILQNLHRARVEQYQGILGPDAKAQVTLFYQDGKPVRAHKVLVSTQHAESASLEKVREIVLPIIENSLPKGWMPSNEDIFVNPTGRFVIGGPDGDTGLTGRKIIVDTYGGAAPHGGGAFSGKDPTKVDRSAAYMMRYLAKNVVAAGLAKRCTFQVAYSIGMAKPLSLYLTTHGTGKVDDQIILDWILKNVDLRPQAVRERLNLNSPIYLRTASYGHFGRSPQDDGGFSWERTDLAKQLSKIN